MRLPVPTQLPVAVLSICGLAACASDTGGGGGSMRVEVPAAGAGSGAPGMESGAPADTDLDGVPDAIEGAVDGDGDGIPAFEDPDEQGESGNPDSLNPLPPPGPAEPCGEDLDADWGTVRPDMGAVAEGGTFAGDPLQAGDFQVSTITGVVANPDREWTDLPVTLYLPSVDGSGAAPGRHPLVMLMPGYGKGLGLALSGTHPTYAFVSEHLASHGFIVAGMDFAAGGVGLPLVTTAGLGAHFLTEQEKNVAEVQAVMKWVLESSAAAASIDATKIAIAGHSQGGKVAFFVAAEDPRIDMVIGWDPQNAGGGQPCGVGGAATCDRLPIAPNCNSDEPGRMHELRAETLVFAARDAGSMPDTHQWAEHFYRGAPSPAHLLLYPDASHESWSDGDNPVAHSTMRAQLALLKTRFLGVTGMDDYLPGSAALEEGIDNVEQYSK